MLIPNSILLSPASEVAGILNWGFTLPCLFSYFYLICISVTETLYKCYLYLFFCTLLFFAQYYVFRFIQVDKCCYSSLAFRMRSLTSNFCITWELVRNKFSGQDQIHLCSPVQNENAGSLVKKLLTISRWQRHRALNQEGGGALVSMFTYPGSQLCFSSYSRLSQQTL